MNEERLKLTIEKISRLGIPVTLEENEGLNEIIGAALQAQDAESEKRTRHACAEAASTTVMQTRLVAGEYVSCEVADELAQRTHAACMNTEVKE